MSVRVEGHLGKGCLHTWTEEIFTVSKRIAKEYPSYKLMGDSGEIIKGCFHEEKLQK